MKRTSAAALLLAVSLAAPLSLPADDGAQRQEVETLFRLTQMEKKINDSVLSVAQLQLGQDPALDGKQDILMAFLQKYIGWNAIRDELAEMYMQAFSENELKEMNAFYITPTGQKVITVVPLLVQQRNQVAMQRLQQNIDELKAAIADAE